MKYSRGGYRKEKSRSLWPKRKTRSSSWNNRGRKGNSGIGKIIGVIFVLGALAYGVFFLFSSLVSNGGTEEFANVNVFNGILELSIAEENEEAKPIWIKSFDEQKIYEGDSLRTGNQGRSRLIVFDKNFFYLGEHSEIQVNTIRTWENGQKQIEISLKKGDLWGFVEVSDFIENQDSQVLIKTDLQTISLPSQFIILNS